MTIKLAIITAISSAILLTIPGAYAQSSSGSDVIVRATIVSLPNAATLRHFPASYDFQSNAAEALATLEKLVKENKATSVGNLAVTTKSGQRAVSESGKMILEVEPIVSPDQKAVDLNVVVTEDGHRVVTSVLIPEGEVKFLGSIQNPKNHSATDYIFIQVSL